MSWEISNNWRNNYLTAINEALTDEAKFFKFRADPRINEIFESVNYNQGQRYLKEAQKLLSTFPNNINLTELLRDDDRFQKQHTMRCNDQDISPNLCRYAFTTCNIIKHFGSPKIIIEIGGGFGGLASMLCKLLPQVGYILVDLPEVLELQKRYLTFTNPQAVIANISYVAPQDIEATSLFISEALVVSCYALDELDKEERQHYHDILLAKAAGVYLTVSRQNIPGNFKISEDPVAGKILLTL